MGKLKFILSDESVNSYGFRTLTSGIDTTDFERNPVMFYNHDRGLLPIGKWANLKRKDGKLIAEAEFDEDDEFAQEVKRKVERGILNAASIGMDIIELSEDKKLIEKGQTRPTVTKSRLFEVSIVDIPGNANALKMNFQKAAVALSGNVPDNILDGLIGKLNHQNLKSQNTMLNKELLAKLGLKEGATDQEIETAIEKKLQKAEKPEAETPKTETLNDKGIAAKITEQLISLGKSKGVINEKNEASYRSLAAKDPDAVLSLIDSAEPKKEENKDTKGGVVADFIAELKKGGNKDDDDDEGRENWSYRDWMKKDSKGLAKLQKNSPEKFEKLLEGERKKLRRT